MDFNLDIFMARTIQKNVEFASQAEVPFFPSSTYQEEKQVYLIYIYIYLYIIKLIMLDTPNGATSLESIHFFLVPKPEKTFRHFRIRHI